jgi:Domain of unknown function (DUF397)
MNEHFACPPVTRCVYVNFALRMILLRFDHLRYGVAYMSKTEQHEGILVWRKSSYSIANGQCVEAAAVPGAVMVRDTVGPARGQLWFSAEAWHEFTAHLKGALVTLCCGKKVQAGPGAARGRAAPGPA